MTKTIIILVVEDEPLILQSAEEALEDAGYIVVATAHGDAAAAVINELIGELAGIVTDVRLPPGGPNGWELARHARELKHDIPIIYTTGDSAAEWTSHGVSKSLVLQKPYGLGQLVTGISTLLNDGDGSLQ